MKILVIELCDFVSYPTGGQLTFVKNMMAAFGNQLILAGYSTEDTIPVGVWTEKEIGGVLYDFFSLARIDKVVEKPLVPKRITGFFQLKRQIRNILSSDFDAIFVQAPEVLCSLPSSVLQKTYVDLPGLSNPIENSRYAWARLFAGSYEYLYYHKLARVKKIWATASESSIKAFISKSPCKLNNIEKMPTRYDSSIFHYMDKDECRISLGIPLSATVFVSVGRLNENKGWRLMIDAFALIKCDNCFMYMIGNGEDEPEIIYYIAQRHLNLNVILAGRKIPSEIAKYLNAADVFLMASLFEGWSTTLVEACACGVPCVVTDFSSAEDMIDDNVNGFVVKSRDEKFYSSKMMEALKLDRNQVREYDKRFEKLSITHLAECMFNDAHKS